MKLIDRLSMHKLLTTILNFILAVLKIVVPQNNKTEDKRVWKPRWRRNDE